ncbi:MAG TPA: hypothetical protein ENN32_03500 [Chloroflexi bacterium]|nr:hypothetical protein [Chloroflexota bacterium]
MCILCTAIPTAVVMGVAKNTKQKAEDDQALQEGLQPHKRLIPAAPATAVVVAGLMALSIFYHTQQG